MHLIRSKAVDRESVRTVGHGSFWVHPAVLDPTAQPGPGCITGQETRMATSQFPVEGTPGVGVGKKL